MINDETQVQDDTLQEETSTEDVETTEESTNEATEPVDQTDWESEAKKWKAIAERNKKKVEDKPKPAEKRTDLSTPDVSPTENVDERILRREGMTDDLIKELKRVARFNETDLLTASTDPMFISIKEKHEQDQRDKEAALGASKGSGAGKPKKDFTTPGLSEDEHRSMWRKQMGM